MGKALVNVSIEAVKAAGQASKQFLLGHEMLLKGLVACSTDGLAWLNQLIGWLKRGQGYELKTERIVEVGLAIESERTEPLSSAELWSPERVFRDVDESWCPEMVVIPPRSFVVGSPENEYRLMQNESPQHHVTFARPFVLGRYPIAFDELDSFCGETDREPPSDEKRDRGLRPVINVSFEDAEAYLYWLTKETGHH